MLPVVVVPFDSRPSSVEALRAACDGVRSGGTVMALHVLRIPRQLPLSASLPWLEGDAQRSCQYAEQIGREEGVAVYADWVQSRDVAGAIVGVAHEVGASAIFLGLAAGRRTLRWLPPWSLAGQIMHQAPCPVLLRAVPPPRPLRDRLASGVPS